MQQQLTRGVLHAQRPHCSDTRSQSGRLPSCQVCKVQEGLLQLLTLTTARATGTLQ